VGTVGIAGIAGATGTAGVARGLEARAVDDDWVDGDLLLRGIFLCNQRE
jgi:hypothetical protein